MSPIRTAIIGLSKSGWAPSAHLPYLQSGEKYQIVAVCNSSLESAEDAIKLYKLPEGTKAYADPEELAKDKDIELVVCSVRVDRHLVTIGPSLKAGKDVFVEWPLGKNLADAKELLRLKNEGGVKVAAVGLQTRQSLAIKKLKQLVENGKIGAVLNSVWVGTSTNGGSRTTESYEYLGRREVGGNLVTIHFGHSIDYIQQVLGYGFQTPPQTLLANRRKTVGLYDSEGILLEKAHPKTSDDTIFLQGTLSSGIPLSLSLRGGPAFKGTPGLDWRISGETGEIRISAPSTLLGVHGPDDIKVQLFDFERDEVEEIPVDKDEFEEEGKYGVPARNVGRIYKELAEGRNTCTFEDAVERHELIDSMYRENGIVA